jgi:shikimate kinase
VVTPLPSLSGISRRSTRRLLSTRWVHVTVKHVVLIGMMGCGKTTVGRLLANQLDREVVDLDARLVIQHGMAITEMFALRGEAWFRDAESELLTSTLASDSGEVLSLGGGAVVRPENRLVMRERSIVVWLRASFETLIQRNGSGFGRPMLAGNPEERIRTLVREREPYYRDAAHIIVDVDDLSAPQTVECVRAAIRSIDPTHWSV